MNNPGVRVRERNLLKMTAEETFVKLQAKQGSRGAHLWLPAKNAPYTAARAMISFFVNKKDAPFGASFDIHLY